MALLTSGRFQKAESELQRARLQAAEQSDTYTLDKVLAELAHLYCLMQPPDFEKAEMYSLERERVNASGQSKLQTATMYYWSMHDPERTVHKVQQAAAQARSEDGGADSFRSGHTVPVLLFTSQGGKNNLQGNKRSVRLVLRSNIVAHLGSLQNALTAPLIRLACE